MKSVYTLASTLIAAFFCLNASAQYTAVRNGKWNDVGPTSVWDVSGKPPANCNGCTITINSGVTDTLNTSITLAASSLLKIGSGGTGAATLLIPSSGGTDWASSFNIILVTDGSSPANSIQMGTNSLLDAGSAGTYDGVMISYSATPIFYIKQIGTAPQAFQGTTVVNFNNAEFGTSISGTATLSSSGVLPITIASFAGAADKNSVTLNWTTALEINSDYFAVQRLSVSSSWETIGKVSAQGNSANTQEYSFTDNAPLQGVNEYRLQAIDKDGKYEYSEIVVVHIGALGSVNIFPNPASDFVNVTLNSTATGSRSIMILNQSGQLLMEKKMDNAAGTTVSLSVSTYPQGNYLIMVVGADGSRQISKLFISHQ